MNKKIVATTLVLCALCNYASGGETLSDTLPIERYIEAAEEGDADAQLRLSILYMQGTGVDRDIKKSAEWYRKAVNHNGSMNTKEIIEIIQSFKDAAAHGDAEAEYYLGMCYTYGAGYYADPGMITSVDDGSLAFYPDFDTGNKLFLQSAEQGYAPAQHELGISYLQYRGVDKNTETAVGWLIKAIKQGYAPAKKELAWHHHVFGAHEDYGIYRGNVISLLTTTNKQEAVKEQEAVKTRRTTAVAITNIKGKTTSNNAENEVVPRTKASRHWLGLFALPVAVGVWLLICQKGKTP